MLLKTILGGAFALVMAVSPALACKGKDIFSDNFSRSDGPWQVNEGVTIGGGFAELKPPGDGAAVAIYEEAQIKDFDMCADITYPQARTPEEGGAGGFFFWVNIDPLSFYIVATLPNGMAGAIRIKGGRNLIVTPFRTYNSIKTGAGVKNTLRVTAKGGTVAVSANDQPAFNFRGQAEDGFIALYAQGRSAWKFSNFKLSEPQ